MTAVVILVGIWCCVSVVAACAWASLMVERRRGEAVIAALQNIPQPEQDPLTVARTREELRRQALAHALRQDVVAQ